MSLEHGARRSAPKDVYSGPSSNMFSFRKNKSGDEMWLEPSPSGGWRETYREMGIARTW
jgi:hypothetical protein